MARKAKISCSAGADDFLACYLAEPPGRICATRFTTLPKRAVRRALTRARVGSARRTAGVEGRAARRGGVHLAPGIATVCLHGVAMPSLEQRRGDEV